MSISPQQLAENRRIIATWAIEARNEGMYDSYVARLERLASEPGAATAETAREWAEHFDGVEKADFLALAAKLHSAAVVTISLTSEEQTAVLCGLMKFATDCDAMAETLLSRSSDSPEQSATRTRSRAEYRRRAGDARKLADRIRGS